MSAANAAVYELRVVLPATLYAIEEFLQRSRAFWQGRQQRRHDFAIELMLRETLTNAVMHGCQCDPAKSVRCIMRVSPCRIFFTVRDEGPGFDWRSTRALESDIDQCSGRGMEILRKYATRVKFNGLGNQVAIAKDFR